MRKFGQKILAIGAILLFSAVSLVAGAQNVSALAATRSNLTAIGLLTGMRWCYENGVIKSNGIRRSSFSSADKLMNELFVGSKNKDGQVWVPTQVGNTVSSSNISCEQVFTGKRPNKDSNSIKGLNSRFGTFKDPAKYGYVPDDAANNQEAGDKTTASIKITASVADASHNNSVETDSSGSITCTGKYSHQKPWIGSAYYQWQIQSCSGTLELKYHDDEGVFFKMEGGTPFGVIFAGKMSPSDEYPINLDHPGALTDIYSPDIKVAEGTAFDRAFKGSIFYKTIKSDIEKSFAYVYGDADANVTVSLEVNGDLSAGSSARSLFKFLMGNSKYAAGIAGTSLASGKKYMTRTTTTTDGITYIMNNASWTSKYVYALYFNYLSDIVKKGPFKDKVTIGDCSKDKPSEGWFYKQEANSWCKINITDENALNKELAVVKSGYLAKGTFRDVLNWLKNENNYKDLEDGSYANGSEPGASDNDEGSEEDSSTACEEASGALGWVICPVMGIMQKAVDGLYEKAIEPLLQVNAKALRTSNGADQSNGVYVAWDQFRGYANIAFAIALTVVIISQLTGVGLNNYSIKKILPRLIMIIILVNISFILCQLAVDVSNVLGSFLNTELTRLAIQIKGAVGGNNNTFFGSWILSGLLNNFLGKAGVALTIAGVSITAAALTWHAWLIPLLLTAVGFIISSLFFLLILAVRQAGIFLLIVLAPLAIICYALPNTKVLFDKWFKLFKTLLITYPICGLMMGGGQFASALLLKVGTDTQAGFFMLITAVIVSVAPFFLIPTVVKNSMGALGNIGAKLSNFGSKAGSFLGGAFVGSRLGDRIKRRADERKANLDETRAYNAQTRRLKRDTSKLNRLNNKIDRRLASGKNVKTADQERAGRLANRILATNKDRMNNELRAEQMRSGGGIEGLLGRQSRGQRDELEKIETANTLAQYKNNEIGGVDFSNLSHEYDKAGNLISRNESSLEAEYERQLDALTANPEDQEAKRKVMALQQHFATQGNPGRAIIQRAFERRLTSGASTTGLHVAARAIANDDRFIGNIKGADRGLYSMVNDLNNTRRDAAGNIIGTAADTHKGAGAAAYYGSRGTSSYTAQAMANLDDEALGRLVENVDNNTISGDELNNLAGSARAALSNPNIHVKPEHEAQLRKIANAGYAQGASSAASVSSTAGSNAMASSSAQEINNASQYIRTLNNGTKFNASANASNNEDYKLVQGMAQNATTALNDTTKTYSQEQVKAMQDVIKAARDMGVTNDVGNNFAQVDPAKIQVRGVEPRAIPTRPANFDEHGNFRDTANPMRQPTAAEREAFNQYVRERAAAERYNRQHHFTPPSGNP